MPRRSPFPPSSDAEPSLIVKRAVIANINEVVSGGILRAGKREYGDNWTGWWLGLDTDGNPKFDITFDDDTYIRFSQAGIQISAEGGALTGLDGAAIVAGSITGTQIAGSAIATEHLAANAVTAAKISVTNLAAVSAQTGALIVDDTLTMGAGGAITWASGDARITADYMDFILQTSETQATRWIDGDSNVLGALSAYGGATLTQVGIMARGPSANKYGKIALSVADSSEENNIADLILNSDDGIHLNVSSAQAGAIIKCSGTVLVSSKIMHGIQGSEAWTAGYDASTGNYIVGEGADLTTKPYLTVEATSGYIGIGTTNPSQLVHIYANVDAVRQLRIENANAGSSATPTVTVASATSTGVFSARNAADPNYPDAFLVNAQADCAGGLILRAAAATGDIHFIAGGGTTDKMILDQAGRLGLGAASPGSLLELNLATEDLEIVDAGSAGATAQDWITVQVGGNTGYIRVYATK